MEASIEDRDKTGPPGTVDTTGGRRAQRRSRHRANGSSLVQADSAAHRQRAFQRARRNTTAVRILRRLMPVGAVLLVAVYVASAFRSFEITAGLPSLPIPQITTEDLTMNNPRYSGYTNDGGSYQVTAKTARQDFSQTNQIELAGISGTLTDAKKVVTKLNAERGLYATDTAVLDLSGRIQVVATNGLAADLTQARIDTKGGTIVSDEPVRVQMNDNRIDAKTLSIKQDEKTAVFQGDVIATLNPSQNEGQATPAARSASINDSGIGQLMGDQNGPVTVTSEALNVDDGSGKAVFAGSVIARQGDAELQTARLSVDYAGDAPNRQGGPPSNAAGGGADQQAGVQGFGAQGNVETITAPGAVRIVRGANQTVLADRAVFNVKAETAVLTGNIQLSNGPTQTATGDEATFDAKSNVAVLDGNVVMSGGPNQQARARRAEFRTTRDQAVLQGDVVVSQGDNALRGGQLFIDRKAGITRLTSPAGWSAQTGRITATLKPQTKPKSTSPETRAQKAASAAGGLGAFRTDPNAPVSIEAGRLDVDDRAKTAVFKTKVVAKQGGFTLKTAALKATYTGSAALGDPGQALGTPSQTASSPRPAQKTPTRVTAIRADGRVEVSSTGGQKATGDWATFDLVKNLVTVGGDVVLSQGKTVVRGTQLSIDMANGRSRITTNTRGAGTGWSTTNGPGSQQVKRGGGAIGQPPASSSKGGRPSLTLYPQDLQSRKKPAGGTSNPNDGAWRARTSQ